MQFTNPNDPVDTNLGQDRTYFNSDAAIRARIITSLKARGVMLGDGISVECGTATVRGAVPTYYQRQLIVHLVRRVHGVSRIVDSLTVTSAPNHSLADLPLDPPRRRSLLLKSIGVATFALTLAACGRSESRIPVFPAQGKVTVDGAAAPGAFIVFHPISAKAPKNIKPSGRVKDDGSFALTTYGDNDGAPAGEYAVTVEWRKLVGEGSDKKAGPNVIPAKLAKPDTTDIKIKIQEGSNEIKPIELVAKGGSSEQG